MISIEPTQVYLAKNGLKYQIERIDYDSGFVETTLSSGRSFEFRIDIFTNWVKAGSLKLI